MHGASVTCLSLSEDQLIISGSSLGSITISGLFSDQKVATLRSTDSTGLYHMPAVKFSLSNMMLNHIVRMFSAIECLNYISS